MPRSRSSSDGLPDGRAAWVGQERVFTPISQLLVREGALTRFEDPTVLPFAGRLRVPLAGVSIDDEELTMATMVRAEGGGPLRTFSGGLSHENGWFHSRKGGGMLGWEGETAYEMLVSAESEHSVVRVATESVQFEFVHEGRRHRYTIDVELVDEDGRLTLVEVKRAEADLDDELRLVLSYVAEVCRRCGIRFIVVFRAEVFRGRLHRRNAHLVYSRVFVEPSDRHLDILWSHGAATGGTTTRGDLAAALSPGSIVLGRALVDALLLGRRVRMDLAARIEDASPVLVI